jgi:hypothetical protein
VIQPDLEETQMTTAEKSMRHARCGGMVRKDGKSGTYVCDRCKAEAPSVVSSGAEGQGNIDEVNLCNPNNEF